MVLIDSLNGYFNAMPNEKFLLLQMHELLMYLNQKGALTLLTLAQHGLLAQVQSPVDLSYLTDALILLRYFEAQGEVRQAISVLKHRDAAHERTIREFQLTSHGIRVGKPLSEFQGVLCGNPIYGGSDERLLQPEANDK
jgi:circadian clock protein KaiC